MSDFYRHTVKRYQQVLQAVSITYFMVTVLLMPSNLLMKRYGAKKYFPVIMVLFGTIASISFCDRGS